MDLGRAYASFTEVWSPRIVVRVNDYELKIARAEGRHVWHAHDTTDELFLVLDGELTIELEDRDPVILGPLHVFTVPRGVRHRPSAAPGTRIAFLEPAGVVNTGDADPAAVADLPSHAGKEL